MSNPAVSAAEHLQTSPAACNTSAHPTRNVWRGFFMRAGTSSVHSITHFVRPFWAHLTEQEHHWARVSSEGTPPAGSVDYEVPQSKMASLVLLG
eukprot:5992762-Amphidinium_carterae.2